VRPRGWVATGLALLLSPAVAEAAVVIGEVAGCVEAETPLLGGGDEGKDRALDLAEMRVAARGRPRVCGRRI
jgi:hypothetical protein